MAETAVVTLADFLLQRIDEDEAADGWHTVECGVNLGYWATGECICGYPSRFIDECNAKRQQLALLDAVNEQGIPILTLRLRDLLPRLLALPYADHPDYREEWRP